MLPVITIMCIERILNKDRLLIWISVILGVMYKMIMKIKMYAIIIQKLLLIKINTGNNILGIHKTKKIRHRNNNKNIEPIYPLLYINPTNLQLNFRNSNLARTCKIYI